MEAVITFLVAVVIGFMLKKRKQLRLAKAVMKQLPAPARDIAEQFETLGFIWRLGSPRKSRQAKRGDVFFDAGPEACAACNGTVYALYKCEPEAGIDNVDALLYLGHACANCHRLFKYSMAAPERIRYAWEPATDLSDFLARLKRGSEQPEESLPERKARLEQQLAGIDAHRDRLRSQLLSVKNQLGESSDEDPYR